jgi:hypothetical protein
MHTCGFFSRGRKGIAIVAWHHSHAKPLVSFEISHHQQSTAVDGPVFSDRAVPKRQGGVCVDYHCMLHVASEYYRSAGWGDMTDASSQPVSSR